jgi:hypothetical protein
MLYIVLFLLIPIEYISGLPISRESLQFRLVECVSDEISSTHILEITNFNETCIKINKSTSNGNEIYYYIIPETNNGAQLKLKTENCSTSITNFHFTFCDNEDSDQNSTDIIQNYPFEINQNENSTMETLIYTGPTVYETLHHLDEEEEEEEDYITTPTYSKQKEEKSSEE